MILQFSDYKPCLICKRNRNINKMKEYNRGIIGASLCYECPECEKKRMDERMEMLKNMESLFKV